MRITTAAVALNLLRRLLERNWLFLAMIGGLLAVFQIVICAAVSTVDVESVLNEVRRSLPAVFQALAGEEVALAMTSRGLMVFAWNHPAVHAMLAAVMILLASRAIAGEVEAGTLELVLSQPISRPLYLATQMTFTLMVLLVLVGFMLAGMEFGLTVFELHTVLQWRAFLPVAANLLSLELAIYGITLFFSASSRDAGRVVNIALLIVLVSYLIQALARLWPAIDFLQTYSLFEYYSPQRVVLLDESPWANSVILLAVGFVSGGGLGWWRFMRRDVP